MKIETMKLSCALPFTLALPAFQVSVFAIAQAAFERLVVAALKGPLTRYTPRKEKGDFSG
jgi:hypothetical protein